MKKLSVLLVVSSLLIFSCTEKRKKTLLSPGPQTFTYEFKPVSDTILPPEIVELTGVNAPQSFVIKPKTIPLKYPSGIVGFSVKKYGATEGLPANNIQDLVIDHRGNIWVGGLGYLSKFDGAAFTNFSPANGAGNLFVSRLLVDSGGSLWIGSFEDIGLHKYDGKFFKPIPLQPGNTEAVNCLMEGPGGDIWAGGTKGLYRVRGDSVTHYGVEHGLPDVYIQNLLSWSNNRILIFTSKGNSLFNGERFEPFTGIPILTSFTPPLKDRNGNIWFLVESEGKYQLGKYDGKSTVYFSEDQGLSDPGLIDGIFNDQSGNIWIMAQNAIFLFQEGRFSRYPNKELGLPRGSHIIEDQTGALWMGSMDGLFKVNTGLADKIEIPQIQDRPEFPRLKLGKNGVKWVSLKQTLIRYDQTVAKAYDLKEITGEGILDFYADKKGHVWISTGAKRNLIQFDGEKFLVFTNHKEYTNLDRIGNISEDSDGNLVFTGKGGLTHFDGKRFVHYGLRQGFADLVFSYLLDSKKRHWVGTLNMGVKVLSEDSVLFVNKQNGLINDYINDLAEDPYGNIWLATDNGVYRFDGKRLINIELTEGYAPIVGGLNLNLADSLLWIGTGNGLYKLPFAEINELSPKLISYSPHNGYDFIPSIVAIQQSLQSDSVGLWMENLSGDIVRFNSKKDREFEPPSLILKNIRINNTNLLWSLLSEPGEQEADSLMFLNESALKFGKSVDTRKIEELNNTFGNIDFDSLRKEGFIPENLQLPFANNSIGFEYAAISPSFGKNTRYRYKLDGHDNNWSPLSYQNEAYFGNMSPGSYTFNLEAVTSFGTSSTLSYSFIVLPPRYRTWWAYVSYVLLIGMSIFTFIRWRTKALQKEKNVLEEKVTARTTELNQSLENLKATQSQLIQSEKMASLGELTAGIAHEIQNPLNFVNNFSSLNTELVSEAREAISSRNLGDAEEILGNIADNEEKIHHHGKRADAIVKGMLQHSQKSSGTKEPTNINALADEYLRLAYHGLRAKDKSFNSTIKTDFDQSIGNINIIPQDIGRVLLNLINNAFYAVDEKKKQIGEGYEPAVTVSTRMVNASENPSIRQSTNSIIISVRDNGNGIPDAIKEKIFQPFFTTKPTGQGTGLGLSLSYDIVKAHGGELKVETKEGEGSEFIIQLSI